MKDVAYSRRWQDIPEDEVEIILESYREDRRNRFRLCQEHNMSLRELQELLFQNRQALGGRIYHPRNKTVDRNHFVAERYSAGWSLDRVAKACEPPICRERVRQILWALGVPTRPRGPISQRVMAEKYQLGT